MLRIVDRYVIREVLLPFLLSLLVLTFMLEIPPILDQGEKLIEKGVAWAIVGRLLLLLLPQALAITIPMALLIGMLVAFGRLSADREFVALQACGVSLYRLVRPVAVLAAVAWAATSYVMIVALPEANQTFREITFNVVAERVGSDVKPRVFFEDFPNRVLYVRDVTPSGWHDVFLADTTRPDQTTVYFARSGRMNVDRTRRTVEMVLEHGTRHSTTPDKVEQYEGTSFERLLLTLDPETVFPRVSLMKGEPEMSISELRESIADAQRRNQPTYNQRLMIQQKFSFPVACPVLALMALGLGVTNRKEGKLASFALGMSVIFAYYLVLWSARSVAKNDLIPTTVAPWVPNIVLGLVGLALLLWRARSADRPIRLALPAWLWRKGPAADASPRDAAPSGRGAARPSRRVVVVVRVPHLNLPRPRILDVYISRQFLTIFGLTFAGLLGLFYVSTFVDLMEKLIRGTATSGMLARYYYFATPQFVYYIIPISTLIATLVTIGLLTKNSELIIIRACGVSLYRSAMPLLLFALLFSGVLFALQERVMANANRRAKQLHHIMRGFPAQTFGVLDRRWIVGASGDIYHYDFFDPRANQFTRLSTYHVIDGDWRLGSLLFAEQASLVRQPGAEGRPVLAWQARRGWTRQFTTTKAPSGARTAVQYAPFAERTVSLEPPAYFKTDVPDAERMTYGQLKAYIAQLSTSGFNVVPYVVQLQRKIAFPFVTLILTLLAVPFAVTTGRRGAMYGVGAGIVLSIVYWVTLSIFAAVGSSGLITPLLAAWAPNILFGAAAVYLVLTVRT